MREEWKSGGRGGGAGAAVTHDVQERHARFRPKFLERVGVDEGGRQVDIAVLHRSVQVHHLRRVQ